MQERLSSQKHFPCTVSVVGYVGTSNERVHVGKSCLINRFLQRMPYCEDQLSVLSRTEFDGEIVGGSHWLYWGEGDVPTCENDVVRTRVIEQCEFVDDQLFVPISVSEPYLERCLAREIVLHTRKLAYVCKHQLGDECLFDQTYLEPGMIHVSAFILAYDITLDGRLAFSQAQFLQQVVQILSAVDIPLVLATTKHDSSATSAAKNLLEFTLVGVKKRWLEKRFCLVETSAKLDINVQTVFRCAVLLASRGLFGRIKGEKRLLNQKAEVHSRSFSLRLKRPVSLKLHYHKFRLGTSDRGNSLFSLDSFLCTKGDSPSTDGRSTMFRTAVTQCAFGSPRMAIPGEVGVGSDLYLIVPPNPLNQKRAPHPGNARPSHQPLRLRTPSTDSSVLPTPPPLLLSGPGSPIYFYGHADSVRCAVASLRSVCPLDGCRTEDGAVHRVCIIAGSTTSLHGQYSTSSPIHSVASSCVVPLNDSAFSVPDSGSTSDCITTHSTVSSCLLPPQADRTSAAVRSTVGAALSTQTGSSSLKPEHCLRILIYSSVTQVLELEGSADSFSSVICSGPSFQDTHAAKPPFHMVLLWLPHSHENEAMLNDLIVHGLSLSSRLNVPFLSACDEYNRQLLDHLVKIVSSSGSSSSFLVGTDPCRARGINWTSFPGVLAIPCLTQLLDPASNIELKLTSLPNAVPLKTVKLLAALVNIGPPLNTPISDFPQSNCVGMQQTAACHSLFLPPTVTAPTAVKAEPPSFSRRRFGSDGPDNSFFQPAWLITMDELLEFLSQDHSGTSPNYAVIIHYLASGWSEIQNELQGFLKFLLDLCAPVGSLSAQTATHLPAHVMLVAIQNETFPKDGGSDATVIGISSGRTCLQTLAVTHDFNFQIWDDLRGEGKIERNHDETASVACAGTLPKTSTGPTIMQSSRSGCCKPCLSFMSVSLKDSTGSEMYQRALGGDPNFWTVAVKSPKTSLVIGHPDSIDRRSGAQISGGIICHQTFDTNFKPQKCKIIFPTNMADMVYSIESVGHKQQESQQQYNPNSTIFGGSDRRHGSNRVELPWLPPAPNIALHTSLPATSLVRSAPECSCVLQTSPSPLTLSATQQLSTWPSRHQNREEIDTQPVIPNIPHSLSSDSYFELNPQITQPSILSAPEAQSSVEEYYAELPKVTHPPGAGSEQHQQRRLNRPKRPRPRTSSSYTSSSSSRSPTPDPCDSQWITTQSSFVMRSPPSRSTPNAQHGQHSASSSAAVSDRVDGESALYAEVDDAVFAIKQATQDTAGLNGPRSVVYGETSFNIPCLRVPSNHAQLLPPVVPTGPIPYRLTCLGSNLPPPPTAQPAFASTRDPSQIDDPASSDVSQRGSSFSHSNYHSSPPTGADGLSHCIIPEDSLSSLVPDSDQLNSFSANHNQFSSGCEIGPSTYSNSLSSKPEENRAPAESCTLSCVNPHMTQTSSTLETITSVFRRRGFWFRHSSNRHSHEQKA